MAARQERVFSPRDRRQDPARPRSDSKKRTLRERTTRSPRRYRPQTGCRRRKNAKQKPAQGAAFQLGAAGRRVGRLGARMDAKPSAPTKNIAKPRAIVICPALIQRQSASPGRRSTRTRRSPNFSNSDRCLKDNPTSAPSGALAGLRTPDRGFAVATLSKAQSKENRARIR